jgi:hypothetical protein
MVGERCCSRPHRSALDSSLDKQVGSPVTQAVMAQMFNAGFNEMFSKTADSKPTNDA